MKAQKVLEILKKNYKNTGTALKFSSVFQLSVAVILSAQCTDERVNMVTSKLFQKLSEPKDFANVKPKELEKMIYSTGFYKNKAKNIIKMSKKILDEYDGKVPQSMEELIKLPGIGRKTANIILSEGYGIIEGIAVDTHVSRLAQRIGLSKNKEPEKIEKDLMQQFPKKDWWFLSNALIWHGRKICTARKPKCSECEIRQYCEFFKNNENLF
ncbi:MAG: endonuclease III [Candidatus Diapherotrites archaeon]